MKKELLIKQLIIDEGKKLQVYADSLGFATVGVGHLLTKDDPEYLQFSTMKKLSKKAEITISDSRCDELLKKDVEIAINYCKKLWPNFDTFLDEVQEICANMMFNIGYPKLKKLFPNFVKAIAVGDYKRAALEMKYNDGLNPKKGLCDWYLQTKSRAERLIKRIESI